MDPNPEFKSSDQKDKVFADKSNKKEHQDLIEDYNKLPMDSIQRQLQR